VADNSASIIAPRALPADSTPAPTATAVAIETPTPAPTAVVVATEMPSATPLATAIAAATPPAGPPSDVEQGEVRRAEPVHAQDLAKAKAALAAVSPSPSPTPQPAKIFDIRPLKKTFVRVTVDTDKGRSSFERWIDANVPVQIRGRRIAVKVLDPNDVEIRKNGKLVVRGDTDVRLE
jgi:hypothetical protein